MFYKTPWDLFSLFFFFLSNHLLYYSIHISIYWSDERSFEERAYLPPFLRKYIFFLIFFFFDTRCHKQQNSKTRLRKSDRYCRRDRYANLKVSINQCWATLKIYMQPIMYAIYCLKYTRILNRII